MFSKALQAKLDMTGVGAQMTGRKKERMAWEKQHPLNLQ